MEEVLLAVISRSIEPSVRYGTLVRRLLRSPFTQIRRMLAAGS
jgi:hypothetical protein